jgi:hypothetical protein
MYFSIPLIPKKRIDNFERVGELLSDTLRSIANQRSGHYTVMICGHDKPGTLDTHGIDVCWIKADWGSREAPNGPSDKFWKRLTIGAEIKRRGGGYVMPLDADDLVSDRLVEAVHDLRDPHGYVITEGYMLDRQTGDIAPIPGAWPNSFDYYCGSCGIFNMAPEDLPNDRTDEECYYAAIRAHHTWTRRAARANRPLRPIPFPAAIYIQNNGVNMHDRRNPARKDVALNLIADNALADTAAIRREFGLPVVHEPA